LEEPSSHVAAGGGDNSHAFSFHCKLKVIAKTGIEFHDKKNEDDDDYY
jgi:hypothetical protein